MDRLTEVLTSLRSLWQQLGGSDLSITDRPEGESTIAVPITYRGDTFGWLQATPPADKQEFAERLLQSWADVLGAVERERQIAEGLTNELIIAWNRLSFLHQVTQLRQQVTDPWQLSLESLRLAADTIEAENAFVAQLSDDALDFRWLEPSYDEHGTRRIVASLQDAEGMLIRNGVEACRKTFPKLSDLQSFVGQQLPVTAGPPSFIGLINQAERGFHTGDIQLLESLAEQITRFIDVEALHAEQIRAEQLNRELEIAREVQASFLPAQLPDLPNYDFASTLIPAQTTSGDFYDVLECRDGGLGFVVCDVSGKGVSAALLAAGIRATIRAVLQEGNVPGEVLRVSNTALLEDMDRTGRFATAILLNLAPDNHELQYASAGHTAALWLQSDTLKVERLPSTTLPLGVLPDIDDTSTPIDLKPDDVLLIYTDGLTEVENEAGKILGMAGVTDVLLATHSAPAQFILDSLIEANERHRDRTPITDDLTLLVIKRQPADAPVPQYLSRLHLPSDLQVLAELDPEFERLRPYLPAGDKADDWLMEVQLAVTELVSNLVRHAYREREGDIHGLIALYDDRLEIDMFDVGTPLETDDLLSVPLEYEQENPPEQGYGLHIIQTVMDVVNYAKTPGDHNHWHLIRRLPT